MPRFKTVHRGLKLLTVDLDKQLLPGSFEHALCYLVDHELDLADFHARYSNSVEGAPAYDPAVLLEIVPLAYSRGIISSRQMEAACRESEEQIFNVNCFSPFRHGKQMSATQVTSCFRRISLRLGFRITPHRFRHTLATDLMRSPDRNLHAVQQLLGHTSLHSTLEYVSTDLNMLKDVVSRRSDECDLKRPNALGDDNRLNRKHPSR